MQLARLKGSRQSVQAVCHAAEVVIGLSSEHEAVAGEQNSIHDDLHSIGPALDNNLVGP